MKIETMDDTLLTLALMALVAKNLWMMCRLAALEWSKVATDG